VRKPVEDALRRRLPDQRARCNDRLVEMAKVKLMTGPKTRMAVFDFLVITINSGPNATKIEITVGD
jgi:hypothetical protein